MGNLGHRGGGKTNHPIASLRSVRHYGTIPGGGRAKENEGGGKVENIGIGPTIYSPIRAVRIDFYRQVKVCAGGRKAMFIIRREKK